MKKKLSILLSAIYLIFITIFLAACNETTVVTAFQKFKNLIKENEVFGLAFFTDSAGGRLMASYSEEENTITTSIVESDFYFEITITEGSDVISWYGKNDYVMSGNFKADTITKDTKYLPYSSTTASELVGYLFNQNCALCLQILLYRADNISKSVDLSVKDFGFTNW